MATVFPGADLRVLPRNYTARSRKRTRGIVLHSTAAGKATSQFGWFSNPSARASSTWHVAKNGHVEQYMDADHIAWAQGGPTGGDGALLSVEVQCSGYEPWTQAQCDAIARIIAWAADRYKFPVRLMGSSKQSETGVGWHRLGVPASYAQKLRGISQTGGQRWSSAVGKICPGDPAIRQIPGVVSAAKGITGGGVTSPAKPAPEATPSGTPSYPGTPINPDGDFGPYTRRAYQTLLKAISRYGGVIDGDFGPVSVRAEQRWLSSLGYYGGVIDGDRGPLTIRALQGFLKGKGIYAGLVDGDFGPMTVTALQRYLNQQREHL